MKKVFSLFLTIFLIGCANNMKPTDFKGQKPRLIIEDYLSGNVKAWNNISPLGFDETFKRMWEFYLSYCEAGFKSRNINLIQFSMSNK